MPADILAHLLRENGRLASPAPASGLEHIVEGYYWYTCNSRQEPVWATLDGQPALIFILDAPHRMTFTGMHNGVMEHAFFCCFGLQNTYITALPEGGRLLVVKFTCNGLYQLLRQPLSTGIAGPLCSIACVWGQEGMALADAVCGASSQQEQVALLDAFIVLKHNRHTPANYLLQAAADIIRENRGQLSVQALCTRLRVNYKWLERNFRHYLGVTPKTYMGTIRFLHAYFSMRQGTADLTGIALYNGYYDQNHFIRECRKHTGKAPSAIVRG